MRVFKMLEPTHRIAWASGAVRHGLHVLLREPRSVEEVMWHLKAPPGRSDLVQAWLNHGCLLKEIRERNERYEVRGGLMGVASDPDEEVLASLVEALGAIHYEGIAGALDRLEDGRRLADINHELVARVSELSAPILDELIDGAVPSAGPLRILEIGCGNGRYLRRALGRNAEAVGVGLDLDSDVAARARELGKSEGLGGRMRVEAGDFRAYEDAEKFDLITSFNLVYYFPLDQRAAVFQRMADLLSPGGRVLVASMCQGGGLGSNVLDVWFSSLQETGRLPRQTEVVAQLEGAGLKMESSARCMPGEAFYSFRARRP